MRFLDAALRLREGVFALALCAITAFWSRPTRSSAGSRSLFILGYTNITLPGGQSGRSVQIQTAVFAIILDARQSRQPMNVFIRPRILHLYIRQLSLLALSFQ